MSRVKKILIIKMSSMGDVIHTFPAVTDVLQAIPNLQIDWVVEEAFADLPPLHPGVHRVIPIALRRWRKNIFHRQTWREIRKFLKSLRRVHYDYIIDAQGLGKSGFITLLAKGKKHGLSWLSAREPWVSLCYNQRIRIEKDQHAIERGRLLFAQSLGYEKPRSDLDYGLVLADFCPLPSFLQNKSPYCLFFHATTWTTKQWPLSHWINLAQKMAEKGYYIVLPWGNDKEHKQAQQIATAHSNCFVLPPLRLSDLVPIIQHAAWVTSVDTGLAHLAAALNKDAMVLYGPTNPDKIGTMGKNQIHIMSPKSCSPKCSRNDCIYADQATCMAQIKDDIVDNKFTYLQEENETIRCFAELRKKSCLH